MKAHPNFVHIVLRQSHVCILTCLTLICQPFKLYGDHADCFHKKKRHKLKTHCSCTHYFSLQCDILNLFFAHLLYCKSCYVSLKSQFLNPQTSVFISYQDALVLLYEAVMSLGWKCIWRSIVIYFKIDF